MFTSPTSRRLALPAATLALVLGSVSAQETDQARPSRTGPLDAQRVIHERGGIFHPESSISREEEIGLFMHTNYVVRTPAPKLDAVGNAVPNAVGTAPSGETPASIRAVYGLPATGGSGVIAIVDAYHYATSLNDFNVFSRQFGLPVETSTSATASTNTVFQVIYASGSKPRANSGWAQEAALDIEWAHAMAPNAKIVLVEAKSNSNSDLATAVNVAKKIAGVRQVSMSYGSTEYSGETLDDANYVQSGVVFVASSGDTGGVINHPGVSPNVVCAGGTKINRNSSGSFTGETGWSGAGGGISLYEARPSYQSGISTIVGTKRGVPDLSFDADPNSGVSVYCSTANAGYSGWLVFGGTSVSAPSLAGIINTAGTARGSFASSSIAELTTIYSHLGSTNFRDETSGTAGGNSCRVGWDAVTGVGSPIGLGGE